MLSHFAAAKTKCKTSNIETSVCCRRPKTKIARNLACVLCAVPFLETTSDTVFTASIALEIERELGILWIYGLFPGAVAVKSECQIGL
jgi:hypothetical protein